jgi:hypothetical protein
VKFRSSAFFFLVHLAATLISLPLFYSAMDKLYRSIGQAPADISTAEAIGTVVFQVATLPLLFLRQLDFSVFSFHDSPSTVWPALLRLLANSVFYVLAASLLTFAWKAVFHRRDAKA